MEIPFRCPTCGDREKFSSLQELRSHLESKHAYRSGQLRKGLSMSSLNGFEDESHMERHSPLLDLFHADAQKLEENIKKLKEDEIINKRRRRDLSDFNHTEGNTVERRKKIGDISEKASFRKYGHSIMKDKRFNSPRFMLKDSSQNTYSPYSYHQWSDEDGGDDSNPYPRSKFPNNSNKTAEKLCSDYRNVNYAHSPSRVDSFTDMNPQFPQSKPSGDRHVHETLSALSQEVMMERASQQATANSLYTAQEILSGVEHAAEERIAQQQQVIETLASQLKNKEKRLTEVTYEMDSLRHLQLQNMERVSILRQRSVDDSRYLQEELQQKQRELDNLSARIAATQQQATQSTPSERPVRLPRTENGNNKPINDNNDLYSHFHQPAIVQTSPTLIPSQRKEGMEDMLTLPLDEKIGPESSGNGKEEELRKVRSKAQQLERDRQNLLLEMQSLLETAASDNDKLQMELETQREKLNKLNSDLEQSKKEQTELLGETSALYIQADVSLAKLKTMLKERDQQLSNMSSSLMNAKETQERLAKERDECKRLAEEREAAYQSALASNTSQVKSLRETLESHQVEKQKLELRLKDLKTELTAKDEKDQELVENVTHLKSELAKREKHQAKMKEELRKREEKLRKAKHEMERMTDYLKRTGEKELKARSKLEEFISGLINRAGKAEAELEKLRASCQSKREEQQKRESREYVPDLSQLPGVNANAIREEKFPKHSGVYNQSQAQSPSRTNYGPLHSTPKDSKYLAADPKGPKRNTGKGGKEGRSFKSAGPKTSHGRQYMEDGNFQSPEESDIFNSSSSTYNTTYSTHDTQQSKQSSVIATVSTIGSLQQEHFHIGNGDSSLATEKASNLAKTLHDIQQSDQSVAVAPEPIYVNNVSLKQQHTPHIDSQANMFTTVNPSQIKPLHDTEQPDQHQMDATVPAFVDMQQHSSYTGNQDSNLMATSHCNPIYFVHDVQQPHQPFSTVPLTNHVNMQHQPLPVDTQTNIYNAWSLPSSTASFPEHAFYPSLEHPQALAQHLHRLSNAPAQLDNSAKLVDRQQAQFKSVNPQQDPQIWRFPTSLPQTLHAGTSLPLSTSLLHQPITQNSALHVDHHQTSQSLTGACQPAVSESDFITPTATNLSAIFTPGHISQQQQQQQQPFRVLTSQIDSRPMFSHHTYVDSLLDPNISANFEYLSTAAPAPYFSTLNIPLKNSTFSATENRFRNTGDHQLRNRMPHMNTSQVYGAFDHASRPSISSAPDFHSRQYKQAEKPLIFENTPEIQKMIRNVARHQAHSTEPEYNWNTLEGHDLSTVMDPGIKRELYHKRELSIDDNGIMWEKGHPYSISETDNKYPPVRKGAFVSSYGIPDTYIFQDDTDIDEDLTDYIYEEDKSHEEATTDLHFKPNSNRVTKAKMSALEQNPLPLGEKIAKLLTSVGVEATASTARQNYNKNLHPQEAEQPKFESEKGRDHETLKKSTGPPNAVHEYSATESLDVNPQKKVSDVQRQNGHAPSPNARAAKLSASSIQSNGFEPDQFDAETDFSSSSYASLVVGQTELQQTKKEPEKNPKTVGEPNKQNNKAPEDVKRTAPPSGVPSSKGDVRPKMIPAAVEPKLENNLTRTKSIIRQPSIDAREKVSNEPAPAENKKKVKSLIVSQKSSVTEDNFIPVRTTEKGLVQSDFVKARLATFESASSPAPGAKVLQRTKTFSDTDTTRNAPEKTQIIGTAETIEKADSDRDQELAQYTDAELRPAKELRARFQQSDTQTTSSEDEPFDDEEPDQTDGASEPQQSLFHKDSVDVGTDTDIEKLARPGYLQKGFSVKKNISRVKHVKRKRTRPKARMNIPSEESMSSSADDLDEEQRAQRQASRKRRVALFRIFAYLDTETLLLVSLVNKEWCKVSRQPALWKHVMLKDHLISSEFLITLSRWCTQTQSLSLQDLRGREIQPEESEEDYQQTIRGSLEPGLEKFLSACQNTITALHIRGCDNILTDKCLWLVSGYCRLLTALTYQTSVDPITPQLMWALGGGCPGITSLFVHPQHPCEKTNVMNNRCLLLIGQFYVDLQELGLGGKEFDKAGLLSLVQSCQQIKGLYLEHCLPVTGDLASALCKAGLKQLQTLSVSGTTVEAKALQTFQNSCRQLNKISVKVTVEDCVADPTKKKDKETYKKMVKALEDLKKKSGFGIIYTLEATPVEESNELNNTEEASPRRFFFF